MAPKRNRFDQAASDGVRQLKKVQKRRQTLQRQRAAKIRKIDEEIAALKEEEEVWLALIKANQAKAIQKGYLPEDKAAKLVNAGGEIKPLKDLPLGDAILALLAKMPAMSCTDILVNLQDRGYSFTQSHPSQSVYSRLNALVLKGALRSYKRQRRRLYEHPNYGARLEKMAAQSRKDQAAIKRYKEKPGTAPLPDPEIQHKQPPAPPVPSR